MPSAGSAVCEVLWSESLLRSVTVPVPSLLILQDGGQPSMQRRTRRSQRRRRSWDSHKVRRRTGRCGEADRAHENPPVYPLDHASARVGRLFLAIKRPKIERDWPGSRKEIRPSSTSSTCARPLCRVSEDGWCVPPPGSSKNLIGTKVPGATPFQENRVGRTGNTGKSQ